VCAQPHHLLLAPSPRHLALLRRICEQSDATGDLLPDAVIAAIALEHGLRGRQPRLGLRAL